MSICIDSVTLRKTEKESSLLRNNNNSGRTVLRCSDNILKSKCTKTLKRKLKKYKLRKDGKEDQEIIDVSQFFIKSLTIKSPNQTIVESNTESSKVYGFKMRREKKDNLDTEAEVYDINSVCSEESLILCQETQEKKQTDAFKLLMDSRNKVIGSNSPGKESVLETCHDPDIVEKKGKNAKRTLLLQKMAQAKGALQKQKREESRELYVKKKMEKRAERLKNMILKSDLNLNREENKVTMCNLSEIKENNLNIEDIKREKNITFNNTESSILPDVLVPKITYNKTVSEEEIEFLNKLSPSIRKKENMLCYFNVITKDSECIAHTSKNDIHDSNQTIIKVKFTHKEKKKNVTVVDDRIQTIPVVANSSDCEFIDKVIYTSEDMENYEISNRQKRKRKKHSNESETVKCIEKISVSTRPKRNKRKPVKFTDNASSTSDEELYIFTPKKKKSIEKKTELVKNNQIENTKCKNNQIENTKCRKKQRTEKSLKQHSSKEYNIHLPSNIVRDKKPKLAPIFMSKPQSTAKELKAKQEFLHCGSPKHFRKNKSSQINNNTSYNTFPKVIHVQQFTPKLVEASNCILSLPLLNNDDEIHVPKAEFQNLLRLDIIKTNDILDVRCNTEFLLKIMKQMYTKFPVYRTYHSLKARSRGEFEELKYNNFDNSIEVINGITDICLDNPDKLKWTDKYKATSTKEIIGNFDSIKELRKWLITWTENDVTKNHSDSSDFCYSDNDSGDVITMRNNLLILTGKSGSGKTSSVYAVASELSMKVIEVNASSKRTGKIMLQDLQEATQSHKVDRQRDKENSQKSSDRVTIVLKKSKKCGRSTKTNEKPSQKSFLAKNEKNIEPFSSQEGMRTVMSLILIDDADIVFDQDDGFCSAVAQIIHSSKRPVILITESLQCPHLQKFLKYGQVINLQPFLPRMLGTWLDILCLVDIGICYPGLGSKLLDFFKGDIRKCINHLQYYITSQKYICKQESIFQGTEIFNNKLDVQDESSSTSWPINYDLEEKSSISNDFWNSSIQYYMCKQLNIYNPSPCLDFNVWWSLPQLLSFGKNEMKTSLQKETVNSKIKILELEAISSTIEDFSFLDLFQTTAALRSDLTSNPWHSTESASLTESENFDYYDRNTEMKQDISHSLMVDSITHAQKILKYDHQTYIHFPPMALQRKRDKIVDIHKSLVVYLNPSVVLDRKAVSLDYWPSCRDICRMERSKTDSKMKRNNRFCHYLKSVNILCRNDDFDKLGESLCPNKNV